MSSLDITVMEVLAVMHRAAGRTDQAEHIERELDEMLRDAAQSWLDQERGEDVDVLSTVGSVLSDVPEPSKSTKHSETCWQRHAHCLMTRIRAEVTGAGWDWQ